ncbi:hypothetical protein C1922_00490 [Stenotrophomonas sp. ZAC14D2_NAIMI4_7]|uniref:XVIPCD domain-containing protein n=1 Tax=Stenotrophomonas sp. ZAC14D2_NAIMI4_7 TaxID=2072405 RepID=UPI000D53CFFE|nr:XVIPCD domain-containing protein [Stenotrophomonas sp. ZAC14D2_NAIMI4_7]AWH15913.1 hypothetical protein C1922_00490 [Stenotrophomonas sp. ZAC14D2_NAIMI4_7]
MPEMDISSAADEVVRLLRQNQARAAAERLEALRDGQAAVVQESLDRYVSVRGAAELGALQAAGGVAAGDRAIVSPMLDRLREASRPPRMPAIPETENLSQAQQHDVYASIIEVRGSAAAHRAMDTQDRVILGLRDESRTTDRRGQGDYNDRIVVLWKDAEGGRHAREFNEATTEPTAQYDAHAATRQPSPGFENVIRKKKTEGEDVNSDGVRDLGRLAEGTTEMQATTHPRRDKPAEFALRPTPAAVTAGLGRVERDSNGDGWFDARDTHGMQELNSTFKIHRGSSRNTDSAGCQTIGGGKYDDFIEVVRGTPGQSNWQYVLTSVAPGQVRERGGQNVPTAALDDPRLPAHRDHPLQQQISEGLRAMGGDYAANADEYSLVMLHEAKAAGLTRVDQVVASNPVRGATAGETLFLVQGSLTDPAAQRVGVNAGEVVETGVEASLRQLQRQSQEQQSQTPPHQTPAQQREAPVMGGR